MSHLGVEGQKNIAQKLDVPFSTLRKYVDGRSLPSFEVLEKIHTATGCDLNWLVTGEGIAPGGEGMKVLGGACADYVDIPLVAPRLAGGTGEVVLSEKVLRHVRFERAWVNEFAQVKDLCLFLVTGDSMRPTVLNEDMVLVDRSRTEMAEGGIFAISRYGELMIKRLRWADGGAIEIGSDNPEHPTRVVSHEADGFRIIGRVVWLAREVRG